MRKQRSRSAVQLISAFVFATRIVQVLFFINLKFQCSCLFLWLHRPVCVRLGRKPQRPFFRIAAHLSKMYDRFTLVVQLFSRFLAHLSRQAHKVSLQDGHDPASVLPSVRRPPFSKIFFSETAWPIKAKFYMKHLWEGGTNVYINNPGHMTKMAAMPIYGKNPSKIFFSGTTGPISTKLGMKHR